MRMNFPTKALMLGLILSGSTMFAPDAQERSAGGSVETQMTWSALSNLVSGANAKSDAVNARMDQVVKCNKKFKVYAPEVTGADGDGCLDNALLVALDGRVDKMEFCGKQSKVYNATTNACVLALDSRVDKMEACGKQTKIWNSATNECVQMTATTPTPGQTCKMMYSTGTKRTGSMNDSTPCGDGTGGWQITGETTRNQNSNTTITTTTCQKMVCK